jgi:hypothetical protein
VKNIILIFVFAISTIATFANKPTLETVERYAISGSVVDNNNLEGLIGASILIVETGQTIYTDFDGNFELPALSSGKYTLKIAMISYQEVLIHDIEINNNMELNLSLHAH